MASDDSDIGRLRHKRDKERIERAFESAFATMASDPGFERLQRKREVEEKAAKLRRGPQLFRKGDSVAYAGGDGAIPPTWVGRVTAYELHYVDLDDGRGGIDPGPHHYYEAKWWDPKLREYHEDFRYQGDLKAAPRVGHGRFQ